MEWKGKGKTVSKTKWLIYFYMHSSFDSSLYTLTGHSSYIYHLPLHHQFHRNQHPMNSSLSSFQQLCKHRISNALQIFCRVILWVNEAQRGCGYQMLPACLVQITLINLTENGNVFFFPSVGHFHQFQILLKLSFTLSYEGAAPSSSSTRNHCFNRH